MKQYRKQIITGTLLAISLIASGAFFLLPTNTTQKIVADNLSSIEKILDTVSSTSTNEEVTTDTTKEEEKAVTTNALEKTLQSIIEQTDQSVEKVRKVAVTLQEKKAEEKQAAAQASQNQPNTAEPSQPTQSQNSNSQNSVTGTQNAANQQTAQNTANTQPAPAPAVATYQAPVQAPAVDTSGFNFNGHHYPLAWFSGSGYVPADGNIYRWQELPSHFLIERAGSAGATIRELGVGSKVVIDGQTYTVFKVLSHVQNDENAWNILTSQGATVTWQSCDATYGANGLATLTLWFAA